jgi:hypothetical protein
MLYALFTPMTGMVGGSLIGKMIKCVVNCSVDLVRQC